MNLQRDAFIKVIHEAARKDKDVVFLSADFGAASLDDFRAELPDQFLHCGISEQHMIDMAAGLALAGKKVFTYCMGPFLSLRCYEQIKCALAMMGQPVTMIGAGVGLGYADAGPTHYVTEDIACLRALNGIEILTPADEVAAVATARLCLDEPHLRYIRLDREPLPTIITGKSDEEFEQGMLDGFHELAVGEHTCIISSGYMLHRALEVRNVLVRPLTVQPINLGVIDLFRIKPIHPDPLIRVLDRYETIVTLEEQCLSGGFGSAILEVMSDNLALKNKRIRRLGLPDRYYFENGGRERLLDEFGLSIGDICTAVILG